MSVLSSCRSRGRGAAWVLVPGLLCVVAAIQEEWFSSSRGVTYDETFYLNAGTLIFRQGDFGVLSGHGVAPLPVVLTYWPAAWLTDRPAPSRSTAWVLRPGDQAAIRIARRFHLLAVFACIGLVFHWLNRRRGGWAATFGTVAFSLSPVVMSSACVAATDYVFAFLVLLTLWALAEYGEAATASRYVGVVVTFGLAVAGKFSALLLLPVIGVTLALVGWRGARGKRWALPRAGLFTVLAMAGVLAGAAAVPAGLYGGDFGAVLDGIEFQRSHNLRGHASYLCGTVSTGGWWYYFPTAFLVKSTPAELVLAVFGAVLVPAFIAQQLRSRHIDTVPFLWWLTIVCIVIFALTCRINIGIRYALPLYPLLILWTVDQAALLAGRFRRSLTLAASVLIVLQTSSAWQIAPDYLCYFNVLAGGPAQGYRWLVDSNLDWGQDLPLVRRTHDAMPGTRLLLHYFGTDNPEDYGIDGVEWDGSTRAEAAGCDVLAVSATNLVGACAEGPEVFRDFRHIEPLARAGYSVFFFDLRTPAGARALQAALDRRPGAN